MHMWKMGQVRQSFTAKEKLRVIAYAEAHGSRSAGREFTIDESNVRSWRKQKDRIQKMPKSKMANRGKSAIWPVIEKELMPWVNDHRQQELSVSSTKLRLKALSVSKTMPNTKARFQNLHGAWTYTYFSETSRRH